MISVAGRQVFKMSIGNTGEKNQARFFKEAIEGDYALLGFEDIDWSDGRYADASAIEKACRKVLPKEKFTKGRVQGPDLFRNRLKVGDIIVVSKGNGLFRAIGEVTGEYEYHPRPTKSIYTHRRPVRWLWVDWDGISAKEIYQCGFSRSTIYRLAEDKLIIPVLERYMNADLHGGSG